MDQLSRREAARRVRVEAAELAAARPVPQHVHNGDEIRYRRWLPYKEMQ